MFDMLKISLMMSVTVGRVRISSVVYDNYDSQSVMEYRMTRGGHDHPHG